jgi:hypothetical protein
MVQSSGLEYEMCSSSAHGTLGVPGLRRIDSIIFIIFMEAVRWKCGHAMERMLGPRVGAAGVVERDDHRRVLAAVEHAGAQVDAAARLLPLHPARHLQVLGG